ncbi:unnamed protein product [Mytilus coruscus]|uniref:RING-type domain-containing protein n=1 Tax=Mytilus coruscus TaxID=42192 RepID=A0A6J8BAA1_MYTCO|nr:unnamed protein product [Mytilus coruscus]
MASRNTVNLITELERRYLECNICTEVFDEDERIPRLLPCHHSFCSECLKRLDRRKDTIKCPTCNAVHKVKKNGPFDFPKDNTRRDLTSFLQDHSDLNAYRKCCECGHTVDNPTHQRAKLKYFCNSANCQSVLCPSCALDDHREISKHALEDIEEAFKKRKKELGIDVESLRTQILRVESIIHKVQKTTGTLQEERDEFHRNVYAIYDRSIKFLEKRRETLLDKYDIAFQRKESKLVTRKDNLGSFLKNASDCCSLSEQLINSNSMSSFLNVHPTVDGHLKLYLNTKVDSTEDEIDLEEKINFDDSLRLFERSINRQENHEGDEDEILLVNQAIGKHKYIFPLI